MAMDGTKVAKEVMAVEKAGTVDMEEVNQVGSSRMKDPGLPNRRRWGWLTWHRNWKVCSALSQQLDALQRLGAR